MAQAARLSLRMQKEFKLLLSDPPPGASFPLLSSDSDASSSSALTTIEAQLEGPEGTVYGGGIFTIKIQIPDRYPFQPPSVTFATPIYHPNIDTGGRICLDILNLPPKGAWQPSLNVSTVLTSLRLLLSEPNPDDGLMCDASREYKYNKEVFDQKARAMTKKYAKAGTGVPAGGNESIQKELKRTDEQALPDRGAHVVRPHIKLGLHSQKLSLESVCGTSKGSDRGDSCDHLSNFDFLHEPQKKLESEKIKRKSEAETNEYGRNHGNTCQTSRKLCLESVSQVRKGNLNCKSGATDNIQSNNQNMHAVSLKTSVLHVDERPELEHQDSRASNIESTRMFPVDKQPSGHLDTCQKIDDLDKEILVTHGWTSAENHCTTINQVRTNSLDHIKNQNQEVRITRLENGSTGESYKKVCPIGKKLSLVSKYASLKQVNGNKENRTPIHQNLPLENVFPSNVSSTASQVGENQEKGVNSNATRYGRVTHMKPSQGPRSTLQCVNDGRNPDNVAEHPTVFAAPVQIYVPNKKHCVSKEVSNGGSNEQEATVESPIQDEVIVLDSEDSEEESIELFRPRLLVRRKPLGKRK